MNRSNFSTRNPNAITAMAVRTQARNVRWFAEWSPKFLIILSDTMHPRNGAINTKRIGAQWDEVLRLATSSKCGRQRTVGALDAFGSSLEEGAYPALGKKQP